MTLWRKLSVRAMAIGLIAAIAGFLSAAATASVLLLQSQRATAEALRDWATHTGPQLCEQTPNDWSFRLPLGAQAFAYDAASRKSLNPAATPLLLDPVDVPAQVGETRILRRNEHRGRVFALRARASGPCALLAVTWPRQNLLAGQIATGVIAFALASVAIAGLGFVAVMRPLTRRVQTLCRAAEAMGVPADYPVVASTARGDELDRIQSSMDFAHRRIVADAQKLTQRLRGLQEHLANIAHDLRTPLASLQAHIEEAMDAELLTEVGPPLGGALNDCVYLAGLTENLRLASQLDEGWNPARAEFLDLGNTVTRVAQRLAHYAQRRKISLNHAVPERSIQVACDPFACEQALSNVIENAIAHLPPQGQIGIVLDCAPENTFSLTIIDDGPGVTASDLERLTQRSFRADAARARDPRGSGLGLAITRTVCDCCGWHLQFSQSEEGGLKVAISGRIEGA